MIGRDNWTGPRPALVAEDVERLHRAMSARPQLAKQDRQTRDVADAFGISLRTIYRYWPGRVEWVSVDDHRCAFLCRPGYPPVALDTAAGSARLADKLP